MDPQQMMAWSLLGLLICNVLTLIGLGVAIAKLVGLLSKVQQESGPAIQKAHAAGWIGNAATCKEIIEGGGNQ